MSTGATLGARTTRAHGTVVESLAAFDASNRKCVVAIACIADDELVVSIKAPVKNIGVIVPSCGPERGIGTLFLIIFGSIAEACSECCKAVSVGTVAVAIPRGFCFELVTGVIDSARGVD